MVPQGGQFRSHQQLGLTSFMETNPTFDPSLYFNMDSSQAAKQMAALSAAGQTRLVTSRPTPLVNTSGGPNSASFLGGINPQNYPGTNFELSPSSSTARMLGSHPFPSTSNSAPFLDPSHQASTPRQANSSALKQRQQGFLHGLANVMATRGTPLPPALTGVPTPNYDPSTSMWKSLEVSSEVGHFRLAGKDVNLFKLWGSVFQSGGGHAVSANNEWGAIITQFNLPDEIPMELPSAGTTSVAHTIERYYMALLYPFEQYYRNNMQDQQKRALAASRPTGQQGPQPSTTPGRPMQMLLGPQPHPGQMVRGGSNHLLGSVNPSGGEQSPISQTSQVQPSTPHTPQGPGSTSANQSGLGSSEANPDLHDLQPGGHSSDTNVLDQEMQGIKRKIEDEEREAKRTRQKTNSDLLGSVSPDRTADDQSSSATSSGAIIAPSAPTTMPVQSRLHQRPSRRKIEYIPLAREIETYGGRDPKFLDRELGGLTQRRQIRDINDWGTVEIEALTMSIRSRLSVELSYALTTFTLLSTMRGQTPGSGFPIFQSPDLFDEMLDLLEDIAFYGAEETSEADPPIVHSHLATNRELVTMTYELQSLPFSGLLSHQGSKDPSLGPRQRPGSIILTILNIIRNLSTVPDNVEFISRHTRLIDLILRLCTVTQDKNGAPSPASPALSLGDLITIRKDTLYTLINIANVVHLSTSSSSITFRMASRAFQLISSYLVDPTEAISPLACVQLAGIPLSGNIKPPSLADVALDVFSQLSQKDSNRQIFAKAIPQEYLLRLFEALVHRLPVVDADFQLMTRDVWLSYLEKTIMAIYSLAFLSPPAVKQRLKADRVLGFKTIMLRMIQKFLMTPSPDGRGWFIVCTRRAIEAMKVLDDAEDSFDTSQSVVPTMSFGMGFGEVGDNRTEPGTGLLGGHRELAWDMLMIREVYGDEVMFGELESLARVEC